jgi:hypothetical protein
MYLCIMNFMFVSNACFTYAQYILDWYVATTYYTFYLNNLINKSVTRKMQFMLEKCKHDQTRTSKWIKTIRSYIFKCTIIVCLSTSNAHIVINSILSLNKIISIYEYMKKKAFVPSPQNITRFTSYLDKHTIQIINW